jgi:hypothetical protein
MTGIMMPIATTPRYMGLSAMIIFFANTNTVTKEKRDKTIFLSNKAIAKAVEAALFFELISPLAFAMGPATFFTVEYTDAALNMPVKRYGAEAANSIIFTVSADAPDPRRDDKKARAMNSTMLI